MIPTRSRLLATLLAATAVASVANAQTYAFTRTELGRIVPSRFATTTQQLLANVDIARTAPAIAEAAEPTKAEVVAESMVPADEWGVIALHDDADADKKADDKQDGFFGSTMGRASILGFAGLAGASYYALRTSDVKAANDQLFYTLGTVKNPSAAQTGLTGIASLPDVAPGAVVTPEPASMALMGVGLGALGLVARRRRTR